MPRKRSFLGKNPGGRFRGIPGNPMPGAKWGGAFAKRGDWGMLNPREWMGFGSRMRFGEAELRPQGQLQRVIEFNLGLEKQMQADKRARSRQRKIDAGVTPPPSTLPPGQLPRRTPGGTTTTTPTAPSAGIKPKAAPKAKPKAISATVKAMKAPVKRGR